MHKRSIALLVPLAGCFGVEDAPPDLSSTSAALVAVVPGAPTCAELGLGRQEFTIASPVSGTYAIDAGNTLDFRYYDDSNTIFFFTNSSIKMGGVLVRAAGQTTMWELNPIENGWGGLQHGVDDPATGLPYTPESVSFCFDYNLFLNPNAYAHHDRRWTWSIAKTGHQASLQLAPGQTFAASYQVTVTPTGPVDSGLSTTGPVFVRNPTPYATRIDAVSVAIGEVAATVTCPVPLPYVLAPFQTLTCDFAAALPDTSDRLVFVDVASDGQLGISRSLETLSFSSHTTSTNQIDECIRIVDDRLPYGGGFLGSACASEGVKTFSYTLPIGPYEACGPFSVANTATFVGLDTGASGSSTWTVGGQVPCAAGCTLTPGYWKTHSDFGPAPYDATWATLGGPSTPFFASGKTYHQALWTPPQGNAYWILAHAYIAAQLNELDGASFTAAAGSFAQATQIFQRYTPAQIAALGSRATVRQQMIGLARELDAYNNGIIGPGHCSE